MKCPNCGKRPLSFFGALGFSGAGFKKTIEGYYKCRHCGTLLWPEQLEGYPRPYWYFLALWMTVNLLAIYAFFSYSSSYPLISSICVFTIVIFSTTLFIGYVNSRYWTFKEVDYEKHDPQSWELTKSGWGLVLIYFILILLSYKFVVNDILLDTVMYRWYRLAVIILYTVAVYAGGAGIVWYLAKDVSET